MSMIKTKHMGHKYSKCKLYSQPNPVTALICTFPLWKQFFHLLYRAEPLPDAICKPGELLCIRAKATQRPAGHSWPTHHGRCRTEPFSQLSSSASPALQGALGPDGRAPEHKSSPWLSSPLCPSLQAMAQSRRSHKELAVTEAVPVALSSRTCSWFASPDTSL